MSLPVTIIGGYLGAGKTTLVNHLLRHANGLRIAVLVNEFGTLPIDADLIEAEDGQMISIAGGCVCCAYGDDMAAAMMDLLALDPRPDHVVLEASGVALPASIAGTVSLLQGFSVDGIVVLADAETAQKNANHKFMGDTVTRQLSQADLVVLNKTDLVQDLGAVTGFVATQTQATVIRATQGQVPPTVLLQSFPDTTLSGPAHAASYYRTLALPADPPMDPQTVAKALAGADLNLLRAKGFVQDASGQRYAIQCVARRAAYEKAAPDAPLGLVAIGLSDTFDEPKIRAALITATLIDA
ncbi:MAG: CobW family GTP-binding protein [Pseudomonadota bacterium]